MTLLHLPIVQASKIALWAVPLSYLLLNDWPPTNPECNSWRTSARRLCGMTSCVISNAPSVFWNCLRTTPSFTWSWFHCWIRRLRWGGWLLVLVTSGVLCCSTSLSTGPMWGSFSCRSRDSCRDRPSRVWTLPVMMLTCVVSSPCSDCSSPHCLQGNLDKASAMECLWPGQCTIVKSYSCNFSNRRANCPSGSLNLHSHVNDPWWDLRVKCLPSKYGRKCWRKFTTASN